MKKIIIGCPTLGSGGVEVSLVRFVKELSKDKNINITLLLLEKKGIYLKDIPKDVHIIEAKYIDDMYKYNGVLKDISHVKGIGNKIKYFNYRYKLKKYKNKNDYKSYYNLIYSKMIPIKDKYDLAIDWHGYGHFITHVISNIDANKKCMWIHDEKNEWINNVEYLLPTFDKIFCVSKACIKSLLKNNASLKNKVDVFYNLVDYENIRKKALEPIDLKFDSNKCNIITVGRLEWQKAYDVAVEIAKELKNKDFNFCWYVIGDGTKKEEINEKIHEYSLEKDFILLGIKKNPFPYIKNSSLYVLSSRHEGYCLSTLEARVLNKVIIATDIESNREQIIDNETGFLCKLDAKDFSNKIIEVYNDKNLMHRVIKKIEKENFDFTDEFEKLYKLIK